MRLFIGIPLPDDVRRAVAGLAAQAGAHIPGRYVLEENYHITLAFLGDAPPESVPRIGEVLARCIARADAPLTKELLQNAGQLFAQLPNEFTRRAILRAYRG